MTEVAGGGLGRCWTQWRMILTATAVSANASVVLHNRTAVDRTASAVVALTYVPVDRGSQENPPCPSPLELLLRKPHFGARRVDEKGSPG